MFNFLNWSTNYQKGIDAGKSGNFEKSVEYLSKCISEDKENFAVFAGRALAYYNLKKYSNAMSDIYNALALNQSNSDVYATKALIEWSMSDLKTAILDYDKAISIDSSDPINFYNRGQIKRDTGDIDGAIEDINSALRLDPDNSLASQLLILCQTLKEVPETYKIFVEKRRKDNK